METNRRKTYLSKVPSWLQAVFTLIVTTIVLFAVDGTLMPFYKSGNIAYDIFDVLVAVGCFFIVRQNPKSIWYVPLICNVFFIISAFLKVGFWDTLLWIPVVSGLGVSILVSVIGAIIGRRGASLGENNP